MSRVSPDTVLRRFAAIALLALAPATLAGCGGDDEPGTASAPPSAPATTATSPTSPGEAAGPAVPNGPPGPKDLEAVTETPESDATVDQASTKERSAPKVKSDIERVRTALNDGGFDPAQSTVSGDATGAFQVGTTTVVFYSSARRAAEASRAFARVLSNNPSVGRIARDESRIYLLSNPKGVTDKDTAAFEKVRKVCEDALK